MANSNVSDDLAAQLSQVTLSDSRAIDGFFMQRKNAGYIPWFNATLANRGPWSGVKLVDNPQNDLLFHQFWNQIPLLFGGDCNVIQFASLMSIVSNEQRGDFKPKAELMGAAGHPGMSYLFDKFGGKRSYNTLAGNKTAFECFNDTDFIGAHQALAMGGQLARTTDTQWQGEVWPAGIATDPGLAVSGFIAQADFMKFRGRGFIQTTGRTNYKALVDFVQSYSGVNSTLDFYQHRWSGMTCEQAASITTNDDWDRLFQQSGMIVAVEAVRAHSERSGGYLALSADPGTLNGTGPGSVFNMGLRISGGTSYAATFKQRVAAVLAAI